MLEIGRRHNRQTVLEFLALACTQRNGNWRPNSLNLDPWKKYKLSWTERADVPEDLLSCISSPRRTQRPPRMPCATKKLMADASEWTFLSQRGPTLPLLVSTWEDLPTKERVVVVVVAAEAAAEAVTVEVIVMMIEVTVEVVAEVVAAVMVGAAEADMAAEVVAGTAEAAEEEAVDLPLLHTTEVSAVAHVPDPTHPVVIDRNGKIILKDLCNVPMFHTILQTIFCFKRAIIKMNEST